MFPKVQHPASSYSPRTLDLQPPWWKRSLERAARRKKLKGENSECEVAGRIGCGEVKRALRVDMTSLRVEFWK